MTGRVFLLFFFCFFISSFGDERAWEFFKVDRPCSSERRTRKLPDRKLIRESTLNTLPVVLRVPAAVLRLFVKVHFKFSWLWLFSIYFPSSPASFFISDSFLLSLSLFVVSKVSLGDSSHRKFKTDCKMQLLKDPTKRFTGSHVQLRNVCKNIRGIVEHFSWIKKKKKKKNGNFSISNPESIQATSLLSMASALLELNSK